MKTLFLMRHAEAEVRSNSGHDFDRKLNPIGTKQAARKGNFLFSMGIQVDEIISSNAKRAIETAQIVSEQLQANFRGEVNTVNELYHGGLGDYLLAISELGNQAESAVIVGHNPNITCLAEYLTNSELEDLPTSGVILIEFDHPWEEISKNSGLFRSQL